MVILMMPYFSITASSQLFQENWFTICIYFQPHHIRYFYDKLCLTPCLIFDHSIFILYILQYILEWHIFSINGSQMFRENWFTTYLLSVISYQISKTNFLLHLYLIFYISLKVRNLNFIIFYNTYLWENKLVSGVWTTVKMGFLSIYYLLSDRLNQRVVTISVNQSMGFLGVVSKL